MVATTITWTPKMSVGIEMIDQDHRQLINLLNEVFTACAMGVGGGVVADAVAELRQYTIVHFEREEAMLLRAGFPECSSHHAEHARLIDELDELAARVADDGSNTAGLEVENFLRRWLINHIMTFDKEYAAFMGTDDSPPTPGIG